MTVATPALDASGLMPIAFSCRAPDDVEAYVVFQPPPRVVAWSVDGDCGALAECTFLITVADPPETIKTVDDYKLDIRGADFVARKGTSDATVRVATARLTSGRLIIRVQTPPALTQSVLLGAW
jgi:hypothetical protein